MRIARSIRALSYWAWMIRPWSVQSLRGRGCWGRRIEIANVRDQGFGVTAQGTAQARRIEPTGIVCFRQADVGEYLREVSRGGEIRVE